MSDNPLRIAVRCTSCGKSYKLDQTLAGKKAKCSCGARIDIPPLAAQSPSTQRVVPERVAENSPAPLPPVAVSASQGDDDFFGDDFSVVAPFSDSDFASPESDELELEAVTQRVVPESIRDSLAAGESASVNAWHAARTGGKSESSWALKFVGVFGLLIMGNAILSGLASIAGLAVYILRPDATLPTTLVFAGLIAFQLMVCFIIYRLGKGLLDGERSAVHGLMVIFALIAGAAIVTAVAVPALLLPALVFLVVSLLVYLLPAVVAYLHWDDFHVAEG
ncbi:hypothetical protein [Lacipirellula parvula]|uniref:Uncharacterized protein n=1 Tax=Lacipirellula parvula TaxID=2650471 RepID=A0A5K7XJ18_9BACT|nr:hypothetical protein [Lacipirellula parvula]BBO35011.1 hypothetical protein PLANPX_4623 [Lacipirellula parvula]